MAEGRNRVKCGHQLVYGASSDAIATEFLAARDRDVDRYACLGVRSGPSEDDAHFVANIADTCDSDILRHFVAVGGLRRKLC